MAMRSETYVISTKKNYFFADGGAILHVCGDDENAERNRRRTREREPREQEMRLAPQAGRPLMGLGTAIDALVRYMESRQDFGVEMKSAVKSLAAKHEASILANRKSSLFDATSVAFLYNVFSEKLPPLKELQERKRSSQPKKIHELDTHSDYAS